LWYPVEERPALEFSPDALPDAQVDVPYTVDILVTQNKTPMFQATLAEGDTLPAGLAIELVLAENNKQVVRISGTPAEAGTFTFTVAVACYGTSVNGQMGQKQYALTVTGGGSPAALVFLPDVLPDAQVGQAYEAAIRVSGNDTPVGDAVISEGSLPAGLAMEKVQSEDIVRISGTPTEAGTFTFTVSVWCFGTNVSGQEGEKEYTITVK
jgi:hypothetical protein